MRFIQILLATIIPASAFALKDWEGNWFGYTSNGPLCIVIKETSTAQFAFSVKYSFNRTIEDCRDSKYLVSENEYSNIAQPAERNGKTYAWRNTSYEYSYSGSDVKNLYAHQTLQYPGMVSVGGREKNICEESVVMRFNLYGKDRARFEETFFDSKDFCMRGVGYGTYFFRYASMTRAK